MMVSILLSTLVMAATPTPTPNANGAPPPVKEFVEKASVPPPTMAAEVKKDCAVKVMGGKNLAEVCMEGNKKICPKGYALKQKPLECPPGKMCAQVMQDYCEKGATK